MEHLGDSFDVQEGGRWGAENRQTSIEQVVGVIQKAFGPSKNADPALVHWITQLENLLSQSYTEQAAYDFKQGFIVLDGSNKFDDGSFQKILKTCSAIANIGRDHIGYVIVGVTENDTTALKIEELFSVNLLSYDNFKIFGVDHEAAALGKNLDQFFQLVSDRAAKSGLSEPLRSYVTSHMKAVRYYDRTIYVFEVIGQDQPSLFDGKFYRRVGTQVKEVPATDFSTFFQQYNS